jgi:arylsulfatase A-like enzyme
VGLVLNKIEALGLMENTVIVFTGDNGGVVSGDDYSTSNLPLRGGKGMQWEGGFRVPLIIWSPDCKAGSISKIPAIGTDFYPTFLDLAKIPLMPAQHADGRSLVPALKGKDMADRYFYWHYPHYGNQGGEPSSVVQYGKWKLIYYYEDGRNELYNLAIDPTESETLNAQYPDKVKELSENLHSWLVQVQAKYPQPDMKYDPLKENEFKQQVIKVLLPKLEAKRLQELNKNYVPNKDWWGSATID